MKKLKQSIKTWFKAIFIALILALIFRAFMFQSFSVTKTNMEKTLCVGDFVVINKLKIGPRSPITLLSVPFFDDIYFELIQLPYWRIMGYDEIKNNDIIVYNYPKINDFPIDKKEKRLSRCVALPGDTLKIYHKEVQINNHTNDTFATLQFAYRITTDGLPISKEFIDKFEVNEGVLVNEKGIYDFFLTQATADSLAKQSNVKYIRKLEDFFDLKSITIFPEKTWNKDFYGPLIIPEKGTTINLNLENIKFYKRIIEQYEENSLNIENNKIIINGIETNSYTFQMNYYFVIDDSRDNSKDSRNWGFLPENHIIGTISFIWFSMDKNSNNIRWNRIGKIM